MTYKISHLTGPGILRLILAGIVILDHTDVIHLGQPAVYSFFILSGYWIAVMWKAKYRHARHSCLTFLFSRAWRLMPVYWLCFAMMIVLIRLLKPWHEFSTYASFSWLVRSVVLVSSASQPQPLVPAWSLDIEMQFYLIFPLLNGLLGHINRNLVVRIVGFFCIAWTLICIPNNLCPIGNYLGLFLLGMLIEHTDWHPASILALTSLGIVAGAVVLPYSLPGLEYLVDRQAWMAASSVQQHASRYYYVALALAALPYIAYSVHVQAGKIDRHCGDWAYSLYLFHWIPKIAIESTTALLQIPHPLYLLLNWSVMIGGSWLIFKVFDQPIDSVRRRYISRQFIQKPCSGN